MHTDSIAERVTSAHKRNMAVMLLKSVSEVYGWKRIDRMDVVFQIIDAGYCTPADLGTKNWKLNMLGCRKWFRPMRLLYGKRPEQ